MALQNKMFYPVREVAEILRVTPKAVREYITRKKLREIRRGRGGDFLVYANDLRVFLGLDPDQSLIARVGNGP